MIVGTMWAAYLFTLLALVSLPDILNQAGIGLGFTLGTGTIIVVAWIAQTFLQVGAPPDHHRRSEHPGPRAADKRSESTYKDAEAVLHEAMQIQAHLAEQDKQLADIIARTRRRPPPIATWPP